MSKQLDGKTCQACHAYLFEDDDIVVCPECGAPVYRVIQAPGLGHSKTDLHYRAKRAGFHTLKRVNKGEYEKMY